MPPALRSLLSAPSSPRLALQLGVVALLGFWAVTIHRLGGLWSALPEYSYGWAVPMLCGMLFIERWRTRPAIFATRKPQASRTALLVVLVTACLFGLARAGLEVIPNWRFSVWVLSLNVVVLSCCILWSVGGMIWVRHFFFPIGFFLLAVPWPDRFEGPFIQSMTEMNAALTVEVMAFLKVAAVRMGNIILIEPGMVGVQEACSGIRSFQSTLMVSLFLGELFRFSFWRRVVFVFVGAMLSFGFNIVRTSFLVWTCNREGLQAVDKFHDPAGWTILGASVTGLALIGWWLYRSQSSVGFQPAGAARIPAATMQPSTRFPISIFCFLLFTLVGTELGIRWWFQIHERPIRNSLVDFGTRFDAEGANLKPLQITREVQAMLEYDRGGGWEWQGGGAEHWQAFYFTWDKPKSLARQIIAAGASTGHQPELCFTRAGMQLRTIYGRKRYVCNGVPLVFKEYEFADRNIPIFVFACTWERNTEQTTTEEDQLKGDPSTGRGIRQAIRQFTRGERGVTDEVRVFKLGVWGPRTIGEAEASFQQQLNLLVQPVKSADLEQRTQKTEMQKN